VIWRAKDEANSATLYHSADILMSQEEEITSVTLGSAVSITLVVSFQSLENFLLNGGVV
jgi:hypothetical protein